jgi:hypothetical protein
MGPAGNYKLQITNYKQITNPTSSQVQFGAAFNFERSKWNRRSIWNALRFEMQRRKVLLTAYH